MPVTSMRLDFVLLHQLDGLAKRHRSDRTTVLKRVVETGLKGVFLEEAIAEYRQKRISAWKAAELAGITLWDFLDELKARGEFFETSEDDLREMIRSI